ncbi:MAG: hypothetical protein LBU65_17475 [Planctomycetaceae bacterium]|nr:hypothetical protein [Planctomycetaceae bacterium]
MNFNFFDWIRDGVKRSILEGTSDAMRTLGMPLDKQESSERIMSFLQDDNTTTNEKQVKFIGNGEPKTKTKKLGRSINDIQPAFNP